MDRHFELCPCLPFSSFAFTEPRGVSESGKAGIEGLAIIHDLRRTFASRMAMAGRGGRELTGLVGGGKAIVKEKLYKHIQSRVQDLHSGRYPQYHKRQFNMGDNTGRGYRTEPWDGPFRVWSFTPNNAVYIPGRSKE